ncbi:MAG: glycosyl hydrolase family 65 protein [Ilumatobacter sp.]|uniref:glycoside hydrolase family 65 protein n=1 Tax=Ilumatobacter sp. TaxID=1967498 RepID=UPI0026378E35|nr:glycosyl hydrolase family 65 protein [Ilumatobacter sp.]MDJ0768401.1 glycosyl hydrolase family 65 protein [Ilumatobacter sp.]
MKLRATASQIPRHRFPIEPWRLVEREPDRHDLGLTESLFAIGNGYIGMRANPSEGREAYTHGTYLNGFHETWPIQHAEEAVAFAKTGQTMVNVPDAKLMKLYVDDEPLALGEADLDHYERAIDFRTGVSHRELTWRTPAGKLVHVRSERMISLEHRHIAVLRFEVTLLDDSAPIVISSQLLNRQDGEDEYHVTAAALGEGVDPRQARKFDKRVLEPKLQRHIDADDRSGGEITLGYRCAESGMTLACAYRHELDTPCESTVETSINHDHAKSVFTIDAHAGETIRLTKFVSYHSSRGIPAEELADRCRRSIRRAQVTGVGELQRQQAAWLDWFWEHADIEVGGDPAGQQAIRWNLFQLAQATARTQEQGVGAKALTGGGYDGHYFWDTEVYVLPFLTYTNPEAARKLLRFRYHMLDAARARAAELSQLGALFPWRTINGEEASAYYAAGTAQYHINAAVAYALERYLTATGDADFLAGEGAEILVETARLYEDLGFYDNNGGEHFHIHGVTGPDEYTTVVNDNLYTNVMARFTMRFAARSVVFLREWNSEAYDALVRRTGLSEEEIAGWHRACDAMYLPYDEEFGIHPQDESFLDRERWDFANTPPDKYPLMLHFHPLVIYRHQVLKQADVVLAMILRGEHFDLETKRRNFDYYDPITTGDSSLAACMQSIMASEVGRPDIGFDYFEQAVYLDIADTHGNTADGVHVANAGGVWATVVYGFAGLVDSGDHIKLQPRIPKAWSSIRFRLRRHGSDLKVSLDSDGATVEVLDGDPVPIRIGDEMLHAGPDQPVRVPSV